MNCADINDKGQIRCPIIRATSAAAVPLFEFKDDHIDENDRWCDYVDKLPKVEAAFKRARMRKLHGL